MVSTAGSGWWVKMIVSRSLIGKIRLWMGGERNGLLPVGKTFLTLELRDDAPLLETDHPQPAAPCYEKRLSDNLTCPLIDNPCPKDKN